MQPNTDNPHPVRRQFRPHLYLWVALIVIVPRLIFVMIAPQRNIYGNASGMQAIADNLVSGKGYTDERGKPDAYFNPGYPFFLAICKRIGGNNLWIVKLGHIVFDTGTALALVWVLSQSALGSVVWAFALGFGLHPLFLHLSNNVNDEPLLTFMVTVSIVVLCHALHQPKAILFVVSAFFAALATYTKSTSILLPFAIAAAIMLIMRIGLRHLVIYVGIYFALLLPWAYRNYVCFGHFTFATRGFGHALFFGSDPNIFANSDIRMQRQAGAELQSRMQAKGIVRPPHYDTFAYEKWKFRMAVENYREMLLERPGYLAWVLYLKATRGLYATENRRSANMLILAIQLPTIFFGLFGLTSFWKNPLTRVKATVLGTCIAYYYFINAMGEPIVRYFVPALPLLLALAAVGLAGLVTRKQVEEFPA